MKHYTILLITLLMLTGCTAAAPVQAPAPAPADDEPGEAAAADVAATDLSYLTEVALSGFEFGSAPKMVYKWTHDVEIAVEGSLTEKDRAALGAVIRDLNELVAPLKVRQVARGGDITIFYGDDSQFAERLPGYTPGNRGYFEVTYGARGHLISADILISTQVDAAARAHLVREELTQSFGFFQDSWRDKESIFYQGWTTTQTYAGRDREIIRLLYDARIKPGMSRTQVESALGV